MTRSERTPKNSAAGPPSSVSDYRPEFSELPWLLKLAERETGKRLDSELHGGHLTKAQFGVLQALVHLKKASSAALARTVFVSPQAMAVIIAGLERKGFVVRRIPPASARTIEATVTRGGMSAFRKGEKAMMRLDDRLRAEYTDEEYRAFVDYLNRLVETMREGDGSRRRRPGG